METLDLFVTLLIAKTNIVEQNVAAYTHIVDNNAPV